MTKLMKIFGASLFALVFLAGCDLLKSEDDKIKDALIGKYYEDDVVIEDGSTIKDVKGEFFKDGIFTYEGTYETVDDETFETLEFTMKITGKWSVKDKFIFYAFDYDKLKIEPEFYMLFLKDEIINALKESNTASKVIDYDASKIIYEDSEGDRHTMKKVY